VDGGGSTTRVAIWLNGCLKVAIEGQTCNVVSVGRTRALTHFQQLLRQVWAQRPHDIQEIESVWCCLSTVSSSAAIDALAAKLIPLLKAEIGDFNDVWFANDLVPLLVFDGRYVERVVAVSGTGTGYCSTNPVLHQCARASGAEYLLSDEGGGFDMGLQGLRAVVRAQDGRGPSTRLSEALIAWKGVNQKHLQQLIYESNEPKVLIASFAEYVLSTALQRDECALEIVHRAAREIGVGIKAVARRAGLLPGYQVVLSGSNLISARHPVLRRCLQELPELKSSSICWIVLKGSPLLAIGECSQIATQCSAFVENVSAILPFRQITVAT
jgi:N-acetylglucosamine kinase-like BadF-type ATPase